MSERKTIDLPFSPEDVRNGAVGTPRVYGVWRMEDNEQSVLTIFSGRLTDDQLRSLHEYLRGWRP